MSRRGCIGAALVCVNPSVNPPCGVLPAPRPGSLLGATTNQKLSPFTGKVDAKWPKGERLSQPKSPSYSPSVGSRRQLPRKRWRLLVHLTSSNIKPALKGEVANEVSRRGCIGAALVCVNPSVNPPCGVLPAPRKGEPFGAPLAKSCPRLRGKWHGEAMTKGERLGDAKC